MNCKIYKLEVFISISLCIILLSFQIPKAEGQINAEEIIEKSIEAQGGRNAFENVKDKVIKATTKIHTPQQDMLGINVTYAKYKPLKIRIEQIIQGINVVTGYDGNNIWLDSMGQVMIAPPIISNVFKASIARDNLLLGYKEKGCEISYVEESEVTNQKCHQIKFTDKEKNETFYCFDCDTYLPVKIEYNVTNQEGAVAKYEILLSEYRSVENLVIPFKTITFINSIKQSESTLTEININQGLEDSLFVMPKKK